MVCTVCFKSRNLPLLVLLKSSPVVFPTVLKKRPSLTATFAVYFSKTYNTQWLIAVLVVAATTSQSSIVTQLNGLFVDASKHRHYCTETLHWFLPHVAGCFSRVNVDSQHVYAANLLIRGSELHSVNFGRQSLNDLSNKCKFPNQRNSMSHDMSERQSLRKKKQKEMPLAVATNSVEGWKKSFFLSACKHMTHAVSNCATLFHSFSWNAEICSSCAIRCSCKPQITHQSLLRHV